MAATRIAITASEVSPFCKVGGLADVTHALPKHLHKLGHEVAVVMPYYQFIDDQVLNKELVAETTIDWLGTSYDVKFLKTQLSDATPVPVYMVYQAELFSHRPKVYGYPDDAVRFGFFCQAVLELFELIQWKPDLIHAHDWQTGLIPYFLKTEKKDSAFWSGVATLFTIHNLAFQMQGMWYEVMRRRDTGRSVLPKNPETFKRTNFTLRAIQTADLINTVSERYAQEILTQKFGEGLDAYLRRRRDRVFGIINGVDYSVFNPSLDKYLKTHYDWNSLDKKLANKEELQRSLGLPAERDVPLIGMAHRLTEQKGFELVMHVLPILLRRPMQFVITGSGSKKYTQFFRAMAKKHPTKVATHLEFSESMASQIYAGSDMFLMPSRFEPCGISQLISLRYGSIPIVHRTGGLADTISDFNPRTGVGTGFIFNTYEPEEFLVALVRAMETYHYPKVWEHLTWQAMRQSFSWELPTRKYAELYGRAIRLHHALG
jgi:starch synthase